jgi:flagellar hook-associated protein 1 FlgK
MSLSASLSAAVSGLATAQRAIATTAHNTANAGTEGYSRQVHSQIATFVDGRGSGVRALAPQRVVDLFLEAGLRRQETVVGRAQAVNEAFRQLQERVLGSATGDGRGLAFELRNLTGTVEALAGQVDGPAAAGRLLDSIGAFTTELGRSAQEVQRLRRDVDRGFAAGVATVNATLAELHAVNQQVARAGATPDLADRQQAALRTLAHYLDMAALVRDNGTIEVTTAAGVTLLDHEPRHLIYQAAPAVGPTTMFGALAVFAARDLDPQTGQPLSGAVGNELVTAGVRAVLGPELLGDAVPDEEQVIVSRLGGGRLDGLLEVRDRLLPELADQLTELGTALRHVLNAASNRLTAVPPPTELVGTRVDLAGFNAAGSSGAAYLAVIDRASGATIATVEVDLGAGSPAAIVAAVDAGLGGLGSAGFDGAGRLVIATANPAHGLAIAAGAGVIRATDAAGRMIDYGFAHYFGLGDLLVATGAGGLGDAALAVRPELLADPARLGTHRIDLDPGPPAAAALGARRDAGLELAGALETSFATIRRGALPGGPATPARYLAELAGALGAAAARADQAASGEQALKDELVTRQASVSGVNLDEELSRLVLFQQSYAASARLISAVNEMFGELLGMVRR